MGKIIFKLLILLIVLVVIAAGIGWAMIDTLAETGIEKGASYALGVKTTVGKVDLSLLGGTLAIEHLRIANPSGFNTPHLMNTTRVETELKTNTLLSDTVEFSKFEIDGLDVNVEGNFSGNNIAKIMANLEKFSFGKDKPGDGKKIKVDRILITNVVGHFSLGGLAKATVNIPPIELRNVTSDNAEGLVISELTARIVTAVLQAVLENSQGDLSVGLKTLLNVDMSGAVKAMGIGETVKVEIKTK